VSLEPATQQFFLIYLPLDIFIALPINFGSVIFLVYLFSRKHGLSLWHMAAGTFGFIIGFLIFVLIIALTSQPEPQKDTAEFRDKRRISTLSVLTVALEHYANDHGLLYPPLRLACESIGALESYLILPERRLLEDIYLDPAEFQIAVSSDRDIYVLRTVLENKDHYALVTDLDGSVLGCNCDDPSYCVLRKNL